MQFKRKPATPIEANQYLLPGHYPKGVKLSKDGRPYVVTIHKQIVYIQPGDWVVAEHDGTHYYPIKDEVFRQTYEPV